MYIKTTNELIELLRTVPEELVLMSIDVAAGEITFQPIISFDPIKARQIAVQWFDEQNNVRKINVRYSSGRTFCTVEK